MKEGFRFLALQIMLALCVCCATIKALVHGAAEGGKKMDELTFPNEHAYCHEVKASLLGKEIEPMLRVYKASPSGLTLQVRAHCGIGDMGRGKRRNMIAGVSLDRTEALALRAKLDEFIGAT